MSRRYLIFGLLISMSFCALAQSDLTFYHMRNLTPQNNIYNPSFFPDAQFYISLPGLSGVSMVSDNGFSYSSVFKKVEGFVDSVAFSKESFLKSIAKGESMNMDGCVSLFQTGFRVSPNGAVRIFSNERVGMHLVFPKQLLSYALDGNGKYLGEEVVQKINGSGSQYREYGVGYVHELVVMGDKKLRIGINLKYLQGIVNVDVSKGAQVKLLTDTATYGITATFENTQFRTAGMGIFGDTVAIENKFDGSAEIDFARKVSYVAANNNKGFGLDIGAEMDVTDKLSVALAINDIGSIRWKEDVETYSMSSTPVTFSGVSLKDGLGSFADVLIDSLDNAVIADPTNTAFKTRLPIRSFLSGSYEVVKNGRVTGSFALRNWTGSSNLSYGLGYTHQFGKVLTLSTTFSKRSHESVSIGAGFGVRAGGVQLYTMVDNVIAYTDVRKMESVSVRFGMNFVFGHKVKDVKEKNSKVKPVKNETDQDIGPFPPGYGIGHLDSLIYDSLRHHGIDPEEHFEWEKEKNDNKFHGSTDGVIPVRTHHNGANMGILQAVGVEICNNAARPRSNKCNEFTPIHVRNGRNTSLHLRDFRDHLFWIELVPIC